MSKLTKEQREEMLARATAGEKALALAVEYGIHESVLGKMLRRRGHYKTRPAAAPKPARSREAWRRLDWDRIARLAQEGEAVGDIARQLDCTPGAVAYALRQMGVMPVRCHAWRAKRYGGAAPVPGVTAKPPRWRKYDWERISELAATGSTPREIACELGCTINGVRYALKAMEGAR